MPKMPTKISFLNNNINMEPDFYLLCILGKQPKVHIKEPLINTMHKPEVCLHTEMFGKGNLLPGIESYQYGAIFINKATRIRFSITIKSKDAIRNKNKIFYNKIETYTGRKMQYFLSDDAKKY